MSPLWSIAALLIQRYAESGAYVPCWNTDGLPPESRSSYQRMPVDEPAVTECVTTSDSWSLNLRYASRNISRSASESSCVVVPDCGMQVPPPHASANDVTDKVVGPVNVELAGVTQSTWNFHVASCVDVVPMETWTFDSPAGGAVEPSRSDGSTPPNDVLVEKHCCDAAWPSSIFDRSMAHDSAPANELPANMLYV